MFWATLFSFNIFRKWRFIFFCSSTGSANLTDTIWLIPNIQGNSWTIVFVQYLLNVMIHFFASPSTGSANVTDLSDTWWQELLGIIWQIPNFLGKFWTTYLVQYLLNVIWSNFFLLLLPRVQQTWRIWVIHDGRNSGAFFVHSHIKWWRLAKIWALTTKLIPLGKVNIT